MSNMTLYLILASPVVTGLLLWWVIRRGKRQQLVQQRLHTLISNNEPPPSLSLLRRVVSTNVFLIPRKYSARLHVELEAAGNWIGIVHLFISGFAAACLVSSFTSIILSLNPFLTILFTFAAACAAPAVVLSMAQARYRRRFLDVFPDALDLIGRGVRAGIPVNEAIAAAGREIADPVGSELRLALDQVQIGVPMIDALQQISTRVRAADYRFLVVALALQAKTGGSLAETLGNLSRVLRARKALRLKARGLTAEAKASAGVLAALPFIVGLAMFMINRKLALTLWVDPRGRFMLGVAIVSLMSGLTAMYVLVKRAVR